MEGTEMKARIRNQLIISIIIILGLTISGLGYFLMQTVNDLASTKDQLRIAQDNYAKASDRYTKLATIHGGTIEGGTAYTISSEDDLIKWFTDYISDNKDELQKARNWYPLFEYMVMQAQAISAGHIVSTSLWYGDPVLMAFTPDHTYFLLYSQETGAQIYRIDDNKGWGVSQDREKWVLVYPLK
jgi:hypothetical protein